MTDPTTPETLVERLAKKASEAWDYNRAGAEHQARWWLRVIADEIDGAVDEMEKNSAGRIVYVAVCQAISDWLRTASEEKGE